MIKKMKNNESEVKNTLCEVKNTGCEVKNEVKSEVKRNYVMALKVAPKNKYLSSSCEAVCLIRRIFVYSAYYESCRHL